MTRHKLTRPKTAPTWVSKATPGVSGTLLHRVVREDLDLDLGHTWARSELAEAAGVSRTTAECWVSAQLAARTMEVAGRRRIGGVSVKTVRPVLDDQARLALDEAEARRFEDRHAASECHHTAQVGIDTPLSPAVADEVPDAIDDTRNRSGEPWAAPADGGWQDGPTHRGFWWCAERRPDGTVGEPELVRIHGSEWRGWLALSWHDFEAFILTPHGDIGAWPTQPSPYDAWQEVPGPTVDIA